MFCGIAPEPARTGGNPDEVTVQDMKTGARRSEARHQGLDVREPDEYEIAHVNGVPLLPLSQLPQRFTELDPEPAILPPLQGRRAFAEGAEVPARAGLQIPQERQRRHHWPGRTKSIIRWRDTEPATRARATSNHDTPAHPEPSIGHPPDSPRGLPGKRLRVDQPSTIHRAGAAWVPLGTPAPRRNTP